MPPSRIGPYELLTRLGEGGMGEVFLAKTPTASLVAVKIIRPGLAADAQMRARFMGEVDHLRMVFGSRVARFEGADLDADPPWLAVEYKSGHTLRQHVERNGPVPADLAAILGAVLAEGVAAIHLAGLVHRDLKPHNVIMGNDGPVIIDFGLARLAERDEHLTLTGVAVGTPAYMPPEQARGERDLTGKADVYALGATLVYALTGHALYPASSPLVLVQRINDPADHPDLTGVPSHIVGLIGTMLAHDPAARPSAAQVMDALVTLVARADRDTLRRRLAELTYVAPQHPLPSDVDDPDQDPEQTDELPTGPTELVPTPKPPEPTPPGDSPVDVSWLLDKVRTRYGRGGSL